MYDKEAKERAIQYGQWFGLLFGAVAIVYHLPFWPLTTPDYVRIVAIAAIGYGLAGLMVYYANTRNVKPIYTASEDEDGGDTEPYDAEPDAPSEDAPPVAEYRTSPPSARMAQAKRPFLSVGNSSLLIPETVGVKAITAIRQARAVGKLDSVSQRALDDIGISRHATSAPNAKSVLGWLVGKGLVDSDGNFTDLGNRAFPLPHSPSRS